MYTLHCTIENKIHATSDPSTTSISQSTISLIFIAACSLGYIIDNAGVNKNKSVDVDYWQKKQKYGQTDRQT